MYMSHPTLRLVPVYALRDRPELELPDAPLRAKVVVSGEDGAACRDGKLLQGFLIESG
jgi:hypothetical protein